MMTPQEQVSVLKEMYQMKDGAFLRYLKDLRQDNLEKLGECPEELSQQLRGRNLALKELIREIEGAAAKLEKAHAGRPNMNKAF